MKITQLTAGKNNLVSMTMEPFYFLNQKQGKGMKKRVFFFFNFIINSMGNLEEATFLPVLWLLWLEEKELLQQDEVKSVLDSE